MSVIVTEPVYRQLARVCRAELERGAMGEGERFPSERDLCARHGVSRATANKVISNLVAEGLLVFRPGVGTFVRGAAPGLHASLREMESFTGHARALGREPATRVLALRRLAAGRLPPRVRAGLGLEDAPAVRVVYLERLRLADGVPVILEHRWLRDEAVPGLARGDVAGSLYALLEERYGLRLAGERHAVRARLLAPREAELLEVALPAAALEVEGPGFDAAGRAIWHQVLLYRGDAYELGNEVVREDGRPRAVTRLQPCAGAGPARVVAAGSGPIS